MIKKFVKFLQGYDIPVKALVLLICLGSFYSAIANNKNTVGHTQAIQSHLGSLYWQSNNVVTHLAFGTKISFEESASVKHTIYSCQYHRQFLFSSGVFLKFLNEFLKFGCIITFKANSKKTRNISLLNLFYVNSCHPTYCL